MSQSVVLKASGLNTYPNLIGSVPDGALLEALNIIIDRNNVIEPRRGFAQYGNTFGISSDRAKQLFTYKDRLLRHYQATLQYDSDGLGTFTSFTGSYTEPETGVRIKSIEANGNFYFLTSEGMKKISAADVSQLMGATIIDAGGVKALDLSASPNYSTTGFLSPESKVAYRVVWGVVDNNQNLILGTPSSRAVVENVSTTNSATVDLEFPVPSQIIDSANTSYFYQLYRTAVFSQNPTPTDPGDEMYLVYEEFWDGSQTSVSINDIYPEDFRKNGTLLYTNPVSGEGIAQANEPPPFAKDIALYKGYTFLANTSSRQRLNISLLSIDSIPGPDNATSTFTITDGTTSTTYRFRGNFESYTATYTGTTGADFLAGAGQPGRYFTLNSSNDERSYYIWYQSGTDELDPLVAGKIGIKVNIAAGDTGASVAQATLTQLELESSDFNTTRSSAVLTIENANNGPVAVSPTDTIAGAFTITKDGVGIGEDAGASPPRVFLPRVPSGAENGPTTSQQIEQASQSMVRIINQVDPLVNAYYDSGFSDIPGKIRFESKTPTAGAFWITAGTTTVGEEFDPTLPTSGNDVTSERETNPNRIYFSKFQQPEAYPLPNFIDIGPKDKEIKRIVALRDGLFIFKEDGIYRLTGETAPFTVALFDSSVILQAGDTACILNNQVYCLTTQGVVTISDTGASVISRPIENRISQLTKVGTSFKTVSFGVPYETDRCYHLWTVTSQNDTVATQCFRYNTFTNAWTRWDLTATCGIVNTLDDKLYIGAGDANFVDQERKSLTKSDQADREFDVEILENEVNDESIGLTSTTNADVGDAVIQTQYLTIYQYNQTLKKLDIDPGVNDDNYFSALQFFPGENARTKIINLANKLDADTQIADNNFFTLIDDYSGSATTVTAGTDTVIDIGAHVLLPGRYITLSGFTTTPSINGTHQIKAVGATTITIEMATSAASPNGTWSTPVQDFRDIQGCYNIIVNKLNNDSGVFFETYIESEDTVDVQGTILEVNQPDDTIMVELSKPFISGPLTIFKAINTRIIYAPQFFGDPSTFKQVSEGTIFFEDSNFTQAQLSFGSDLSPAFEAIDFSGQGSGDFGDFPWGNQNWGGIGAAIPLRTYVPRQKQRCRYMNVRYMHKVALERFAIFGISLTFRPYSTRAYK